MNEELNGNDLNGSIDAQEGTSLESAEVEEVDYDAHPPEDDSRLIELVGFLVQGVVAHPDEVEVEEFFDDIGTVYGVRVHPDDVGRIIGKDGRIANALRQVVKAAATKAGTHVMVEILTEDAALPLVDSNDDSDADADTEAAPEA